MHLLLSIAGFCLTFGGINAASISGRTGIQSLSETADFEKLDNNNGAAAFPIPTPYKYLKYISVVYGSPLEESIKPSSGSSLAIAPYILSGTPTEDPEITISFPGSKATSFDMESIAYACAAPVQNGFVVPAVSCTIHFTGIKAADDKEVSFNAKFKAVGKLNVFGIALFGVKLAEVEFPVEDFKGLRSLKFAVLTSDLPLVEGTAQMGLDDIKYKVHLEGET